MVQPINLLSRSKKLYFLIHGYTGSPTDFNGLPEYLHDSCGADVKVMLLPGHGTKIEDLDDLEFGDFIREVEGELRGDVEKYDEVIIGGVSFGAQLALILASRYPVQGVFNICLPYKLKFPFNIPGLGLLGYFKKYWPKIIPEEQKVLREGSFHYKEAHAKGLKIVKQANRELRKSLPKITCPTITIYSKNDRVCDYEAFRKVEKRIKAPHSKAIFDEKAHNIFFSEKRFDVYKKIVDFLKSNQMKKNTKKDKIAAIIPAYNEGSRIGNVLKVLSETEILDEIIVVNDGSSDNTSENVRKFAKIKLLENDKNMGKAYSLQRGIDSTDANILFFCDADLKNLTPKIVTEIIKPVINGQYDMYVGVRNNAMQKAITLFALNSGERALRRELWDRLPEKFKYRYRIEAGLNFTAKSQRSEERRGGKEGRSRWSPYH